MPLLKICGLRHPDQAAAVAALGVDAIGVIAVPASPRYLAAELRPALFEAVAATRPQCRRVLVVADPSPEQVEELLLERGHQVVQLHGGESVAFCADLRRRWDGEIWTALRIRTAAYLALATSYVDVVDGLLLDAWQPDQLGGTGQRLPLEWLEDFSPKQPWWLAGGITPERVASVLRQVNPAGLDASSGVERSPGDKDLERVEALVAAVRQGESFLSR